MKIIITEIARCYECPHCEIYRRGKPGDDNLIHVCFQNPEHIGIVVRTSSEGFGSVPHWCPLPDKDKISRAPIEPASDIDWLKDCVRHARKAAGLPETENTTQGTHED